MILAKWSWHCNLCPFQCKYEYEIIDHLEKVHDYYRFTDYEFTSDAIVTKEGVSHT